MKADWWRDAVLYQIYPRSYSDHDGDGVGDLRGIIERLDHLAWLGIDGIWLNPIMSSPNADWGYDVSDYCSVDEELGSMADLDELVAEAQRRGIGVLLDLVPNHTSDRHPWFAEARSSRSSPYRDRYVWEDPSRGGPPNNWLSAFGGPAWTFDDVTGQFYLHNFLAEQPDLNWWSEDVRVAFDEVLRFWFERGIAGFRIDVAHAIVKDALLRDNPPATEADHPIIRRHGQRLVYNADRPEVHDVLQRWRSLAEGWNPPRVLIGEVYVLDIVRLAAYYGARSDELHMAFNFPFVHLDLDAAAMAATVEATEEALPPDAWPAWTGSNHDALRFPSRWCRGDEALVRCCLLVLLMLRGTPVLYYGDEIGMTNVELGRDDLLDPVGLRTWPAESGRDPGRTPMQWSAAPGAGFAPQGVRPWLPVGDHEGCNVEDQKADRSSVLHLCRDLIALRRAHPELRSGPYARLDSPAPTWVWSRGDRFTVAVNLSEQSVEVPGLAGTVLVSTTRARDGESSRSLVLGPREAAVLRTAAS